MAEPTAGDTKHSSSQGLDISKAHASQASGTAPDIFEPLDGSHYLAIWSDFNEDHRQIRKDNWEHVPRKDREELVKSYGGEKQFKKARARAIQKALDTTKASNSTATDVTNHLRPFMTNTLGEKETQICDAVRTAATENVLTHGQNSYTPILLNDKETKAAVSDAADSIVHKVISNRVAHEAGKASFYSQNKHQLDEERDELFHDLAQSIYTSAVQAAGDNNTFDFDLGVWPMRDPGDMVRFEMRGGFKIEDGKVLSKDVTQAISKPW